MSKLLFEEVPRKSREYMREQRTRKIMALVMAALFLIFGVVCLFLKLYAISALPFLFALLFGLVWVELFLQGKQYLHIFDDKICYKKTYQRNGNEIAVSPQEYTVTLQRDFSRRGYTVQFIFMKTSGEKLLTYKAVSLVPSQLQAGQKQWEKDLLAMNCAVIDHQEIIKNR